MREQKTDNTTPFTRVREAFLDEKQFEPLLDKMTTAMNDAREETKSTETQRLYTFLTICFFENVPFQIAL